MLRRCQHAQKVIFCLPAHKESLPIHFQGKVEIQVVQLVLYFPARSDYLEKFLFLTYLSFRSELKY